MTGQRRYGDPYNDSFDDLTALRIRRAGRRLWAQWREAAKAAEANEPEPAAQAAVASVRHLTVVR